MYQCSFFGELGYFQETFLEKMFKQEATHYFSGIFLDLFAVKIVAQSRTVEHIRKDALSKLNYLEILYGLISRLEKH